jgi:hypothetical protein
MFRHIMKMTFYFIDTRYVQGKGKVIVDEVVPLQNAKDALNKV